MKFLCTFFKRPHKFLYYKIEIEGMEPFLKRECQRCGHSELAQKVTGTDRRELTAFGVGDKTRLSWDRKLI